ncbi:MAG TPA: arylsulfotransferase family protein [Thermoanaerobaculia bacterium]|nr:arylsulfotransferase family protein [Thermoanaerobaculia bacterium]
MPAASQADPSQGKWRRARSGPVPPSTSDSSERPADVKALPYLQGYRPAQDRPLVIEHDRAATFQGLNFYLSGHAAEAVLADMQGKVLHRWRYPLRRLFPELAKDPEMAKLEYWRRAWLFPNGDLIGIYEGLGVVKLDARSRVLWSRRGGFHHDLSVQENGEIWILDREGKVLPRINPKEGILEDFVTVLSPDGKVLRRISILQAFEHSPYAGLMSRMPREGDVFHTNTLEVLDDSAAGRDPGGERDPAFRPGNLLISVLKLDAIAVLDPASQTIVWARTGPWRRQHQPTRLANGDILLFDNTGAGRDRSRVLEIDPSTGKTVWEYSGAGGDFSSRTLGSCQRLPNGNTLITESENGRAFEVTPAGRTVWELYNPNRAGENRELVAVLFELVRLPPDFPFRGLTIDAR